MRRCLLIFILLSVGFFPQVKKSEMSEMRIIGKGEFHAEELVDNNIRDANNLVAAGLIIETDLIGLAYDANNGMVKMNHLPGRDFLYLQPSERVITIMANGYAPLQVILRNYGIKLVSGQSWLLKLTADKKGELIPVTISTTPGGATIFIDGENKGQIITLPLKDGPHDLKIELGGHSPVSAKINVNINNALFEYKLEQKDPVTLSIVSMPSGANIFIDNVEKGTTPKALFLFPGEYELKINHAGYSDAVKKITVTAKGPNVENLNLKKSVGTLTLNIQPGTATVAVDNELQNKTDEIILAAGKHQLTISKDGFYTATEVVEIKLNEFTAREIKLKEITGTLQANVLPPDAEVEITKGTYRNSWSGTKTVKGLGIGGYLLVVKKSGYKEFSSQVKIEENKTAAIKINLEKAKPGILKNQNDTNITAEQAARILRPELFKPKEKLESKSDYDSRVAEAKEITAKFNNNPADIKSVLKLIKIEASKKELGGFSIESIGTYDSEEEVFPVQINGQKGTLPVPKANAKKFKENYISAIVKGSSRLNWTLTKEIFYLYTVTDPVSGSKYEFRESLPNMAFVNGGTFRRDGGEVTVSSFSIGKYEVTQKEWEEVMDQNPSTFKGANRPVENVSWFDVQDYIYRLNRITGMNYRLPTEAEWEFAAKGGNNSNDYEYSGGNSINEVAWYSDNSNNETHEVGLKKPNVLGLYDMSGNVWELCWDWFGDSYENNKTLNPKGPASGTYHVIRGGSGIQNQNYCDVSYRGMENPDTRHHSLGFRLVQGVDITIKVKEQKIKEKSKTENIAFKDRNGNVKEVYQVPKESYAELGKTTQTVDNTDINLDALNLPDNADQGGKEVVEEKQEIFKYVEEMPSFPNGQDELMKFFGQNVKYPEIARRAGVEGKVFVQFVVGKDGRVGQVSIAKGIGAGCDEEAIRVVKMMPKWTPGKQNGRTVLVQVIVPIIFKLQ